MSRLQRIFHLSLLQEKILFTALILIILIIGKTLPLPLVDVSTFNEQTQTNDFLSVALSVTGGDLERVSLFTLGIGPYMSTMIIWRFIAMSKWYKKLKIPLKRESIYRNLLTLVIGLIQALALVLSYPLIDKDNLPEGLAQTILVIFLLAGTFYLVWLGNKNSQYGIGGPTIIILANMLLRIPRNFSGMQTYFLGVASQIEMILIIFIFLFSAFTAVTTVLMERGERRIPLNRVMINNDFAEKSYLPIKANPSGGMAIMYAMTLAALPRYILQLILMINPQAVWAQDLIMKLNTTHPLGAAFYLSMIIILSLGFAFVNVDPEDLAENLQKTGDYISGYNPGLETAKYLQRKILNMAIIGSGYMAIIVGIPLALGLIFPEYSRLFGMVTSTLILFSLFMMIIDEIQALSLRDKYKPLFE